MEFDQPEYGEEGEENIIQVGNFLIDESRVLGEGAFGKVYLCQEIPEDCDVSQMDANKSKTDASQFNDVDMEKSCFITSKLISHIDDASIIQAGIDSGSKFQYAPRATTYQRQNTQMGKSVSMI